MVKRMIEFTGENARKAALALTRAGVILFQDQLRHM